MHYGFVVVVGMLTMISSDHLTPTFRQVVAPRSCGDQTMDVFHHLIFETDKFDRSVLSYIDGHLMHRI